MLRVLTLASLFPDASRPTFGLFVERQTLGLAARADVAVEVVAPLGLPPWPLNRHPHYRGGATLPARESRNGLTVHRPRFPLIPGIGARFHPAAIARVLCPLLTRIRQDFPFDVIDAQFFFPDGPAAARLAHHFGVPFSIKARGADIHYWAARADTGPQILAAARAADGLLAVSARMKADVAALGIAADRVRVHHTGVDLDRFAPADRTAAKAALGLSGPVIATVGALIPRKGQDIVIDAMADIVDASLLLVGDGPDRRMLKARAARFGSRIRFLGNRPHTALPALLAAADVMALPSASEGLANVWIEALACGTPIVITDVGGAREVLDDDSAGRIVTRTPGAIAAAITALLAAPPDKNAVRRVAERFTWQRNSATLFDHLSTLAGRH